IASIMRGQMTLVTLGVLLGLLDWAFPSKRYRAQILSLRERGATIIFSTHRMESVEELCDNIALINRAQKVLDGPVKEIKDAYKTDTYQIIGNGQLLITSPDFEVLEQHDNHGIFRANVRLLNNTTPNDLLRYLVQRVEVHSFVELVPSINDIFIRKVKETHHV
ncbi:MAG: DUF4162 domain-containing protein, partial [Hymenobacteraceae bacterium]|nr:DUF4162 domain-containing protein [Hymenobacteraceae bacterium]